MSVGFGVSLKLENHPMQFATADYMLRDGQPLAAVPHTNTHTHTHTHQRNTNPHSYGSVRSVSNKFIQARRSLRGQISASRRSHVAARGCTLYVRYVVRLGSGPFGSLCPGLRSCWEHGSWVQSPAGDVSDTRRYSECARGRAIAGVVNMVCERASFLWTLFGSDV